MRTRLTYVFPCATGALRLAILSAAERLDDPAVGKLLWLALFISAASCIVCCIYLVIQGVFSCPLFCTKKRSNSLSCFTVLHQQPAIAVACFNGCAAAGELFILLWSAKKAPRSSWSMLLCSYAQAQMLTSVVCDTTGLWWTPMQCPSGQMLGGASALLFGTVLLQTLEFSGPRPVTSTALPMILCYGAGLLSVLNYALSRKLSVILHSYWGGTSVSCFQQVVIFATGALIVERHHGHWTSVSKNYNDRAMVFLTIAAALCFVVASLCSQFFTDRGGLFPVTGPAAAGQVLLYELLHTLNWDSTAQSTSTDGAAVSGYSVIASFFVLLGSVFVWIGRWSRFSTVHRPRRQASRHHRKSTYLGDTHHPDTLNTNAVAFPSRPQATVGTSPYEYAHLAQQPAQASAEHSQHEPLSATKSNITIDVLLER